MSKYYISTSIPYVNATPHIGFVLEIVQADVLARYHRSIGDEVFFLTGTDENSLKNVRVESFEGLLVNYVKTQKTNIVIRGLRAISDFEYELQMVLMNRRLNNSVETIFLMPEEHYSYLSSSLVKEIVYSGGNISKFVPSVVEKALRKKFSVDKSGRSW